jgi:phosphate transport system substrate-binding protein
MKPNLWFVFSTLLVLSLVLSACASQPTPTSQAAPTTVLDESDEIDPAAYAGNIITAGSSTVFPLTERMAERFKDEGFEGRGEVFIASIGSGAGLERFCTAGETDIANSSRAIKASEREACLAIGRDPLEFLVGVDALTVVVSNENTFLTGVTQEQLVLIFSTAEKWSDVDPAWPDEIIRRYIPGTDSGTFDFFVEVVFGNEKEPILNARNLNLSEDDNVLVQGVKGSPYAVGFFGFAYYHENENQLKAVSIDGVMPNEQTAESGEYPLARPLFLYSDAGIMRTKPQVAAFIKFYLDYVREEILSVGYFPVSEEALDDARQVWQDAVE